MQEQANSGSENGPGKETTVSPTTHRTTSEQPDHDQEHDLLDTDGHDGHDG